MNAGIIVIIFILFLYFLCVTIMSGCIISYKYIKDKFFPDDFKIYTDYFYCRIAEVLNLKIFDNPMFLGESNCSNPWGPKIEYGEMCSSRKNSDCKGDPNHYGFAHCYCGSERQNYQAARDRLQAGPAGLLSEPETYDDSSCACGWPTGTTLELNQTCPAGLTNESSSDYGGFCTDELECDCKKFDGFPDINAKGIRCKCIVEEEINSIGDLLEYAYEELTELGFFLLEEVIIPELLEAAEMLGLSDFIGSLEDLGLRVGAVINMLTNTILQVISIMNREFYYAINQREFCNNSMDFHILSEYDLNHWDARRERKNDPSQTIAIVNFEYSCNNIFHKMIFTEFGMNVLTMSEPPINIDYTPVLGTCVYGDHGGCVDFGPLVYDTIDGITYRQHLDAKLKYIYQGTEEFNKLSTFQHLLKNGCKPFDSYFSNSKLGRTHRNNSDTFYEEEYDIYNIIRNYYSNIVSIENTMNHMLESEFNRLNPDTDIDPSDTDPSDNVPTYTSGSNCVPGIPRTYPGFKSINAIRKIYNTNRLEGTQGGSNLPNFSELLHDVSYTSSVIQSNLNLEQRYDIKLATQNALFYNHYSYCNKLKQTFFSTSEYSKVNIQREIGGWCKPGCRTNHCTDVADASRRLRCERDSCCRSREGRGSKEKFYHYSIDIQYSKKGFLDAGVYTNEQNDTRISDLLYNDIHVYNHDSFSYQESSDQTIEDITDDIKNYMYNKIAIDYDPHSCKRSMHRRRASELCDVTNCKSFNDYYNPENNCSYYTRQEGTWSIGGLGSPVQYVRNVYTSECGEHLKYLNTYNTDVDILPEHLETHIKFGQAPNVEYNRKDNAEGRSLREPEQRKMDQIGIITNNNFNLNFFGLKEDCNNNEKVHRQFENSDVLSEDYGFKNVKNQESRNSKLEHKPHYDNLSYRNISLCNKKKNEINERMQSIDPSSEEYLELFAKRSRLEQHIIKLEETNLYGSSSLTKEGHYLKNEDIIKERKNYDSLRYNNRNYYTFIYNLSELSSLNFIFHDITNYITNYVINLNLYYKHYIQYYINEILSYYKKHVIDYHKYQYQSLIHTTNNVENYFFIHNNTIYDDVSRNRIGFHAHNRTGYDKCDKEYNITRNSEISYTEEIGMKRADGRASNSSPSYAQIEDDLNPKKDVNNNILLKIKKMYNSLIDRYDTIFSTNNVNTEGKYETIMSTYPNYLYKYPVHKYIQCPSESSNGSYEYKSRNYDTNGISSNKSVFYDFYELPDPLVAPNKIFKDDNGLDINKDIPSNSELDKILYEISSYKIINIIDELLYIELKRPNENGQKTCNNNITILNKLKYPILKLRIEMKAEIDNLKLIIEKKSDNYLKFLDSGKLTVGRSISNKSDYGDFVYSSPLPPNNFWNTYNLPGYETVLQYLERRLFNPYYKITRNGIQDITDGKYYYKTSYREEQSSQSSPSKEFCMSPWSSTSTRTAPDSLYAYLKNHYSILPTDYIDKRILESIEYHLFRIIILDEEIEYPNRIITGFKTNETVKCEINAMKNEYNLCVEIPTDENLDDPLMDGSTPSEGTSSAHTAQCNPSDSANKACFCKGPTETLSCNDVTIRYNDDRCHE